MNSRSENWVRLDIREADYVSLPPETRSLFEIVKVEPKDYDYSEDEKWQLLRKEATKYYKKQKEREYEIRHSKAD